MIERFRKELDRTLSHCLNPHAGISMSRNEDDRDIAFLIFQPSLQLQTRHPRHKDVSYQARGLTVQTGCEEFFRGSKAPCDQSSRFHQVSQRILHGLIVINDRNQLGHFASSVSSQLVSTLSPKHTFCNSRIFNQHQDVVFPLSERWHLNGKYVEPIKKVQAEGPIAYRCLQITIRGSDDANVYSNWSSSPNSLEFAFL